MQYLLKLIIAIYIKFDAEHILLVIRMLREILILKGKYQIFKRTYGEGISIQALSPILVSLIDFLKEAKENTIEFMNIINFKIAYATDIEHNLLFIFILYILPDQSTLFQLSVFPVL